MMDMEYNRTSPFISNCLHYSSEFHPYVGEFSYICLLIGGLILLQMRIRLFTIPNLLTLMNLLCGSFAVVAALMYNDLTLAFWLIVAGIVFDFFDGFVARLLHSSSAIGVQLDSLADVITSGLAPAAVLWQVCLQTEPCWLPEGWKLGYGVFVLAAFSALRLAKFNIDETQTVEFCGLPTPAGSLLCASLGMLWQQGMLALSSDGVLLVAVLTSLLLVSPIRMFALKFHGFGWRGNEVRYLFLLASIVLIIILRTYAIPVIIVLYIVVSAVRWLCMRSGNPDKAPKA